jgi:cell division protein FtsW
VKIRPLFPLVDESVNAWATEARLLRWLTFLWVLLGLVCLFSASYASADADFGNGLYYVIRQGIWLLAGLVCFGVLVNTPLRMVLQIADWGMLLVLGLVMLTLVPGLGTTVNGASRWLALGPLPILQPSELIKPFLVLQSARVFGQWEQIRPPTRWLWLGIFALLLGSILLQPNLSTAALCGMLLWLVALAAGLPIVQLGGTAIAGFFLAVLSVSFRSYQRERIMSFLNPWADATQNGYQLVQSLLAVASGGALGQGYGMSQQKLDYLPIHFTDFIFSIYAEEFGLLGSLLLLLMLLAFATIGLRVALQATQRVHQLVAIGVVVLLVGQSLLNIGVATGALPTTGLPFPMFSYGGSSMIASLAASGLLIRVARENASANTVLPFVKGRSRGSSRRPSLPSASRGDRTS